MKRTIFNLLLPMLLSSCVQQKEVLPRNWTIAADLPPAPDGTAHLGVAGPVAGVHNGVLVVGGGANFPGAMPWLGGSKKYYSDLFVYTKNETTLRRVDGIFQLPYALAYAASCNTPDGIIVAGGESTEGLSNRVLRIQWMGNEAGLMIDSLPHLPEAVTNASIAFDSKYLYIAGGETAAGPTTRFMRINLDDPEQGWQQLPPVPKPVSHAVLASLHTNGEGDIYLVGGRCKTASGISNLYRSVFMFNTAGNTWVQKSDLPYALSAGTGIAPTPSSILFFGGDKGGTIHRAETLIAAIANEKDSAKKNALNREKISVQSTHPGFSNSVLQYDADADAWKEMDNVPFAVPVTTTAFQWDQQVYITSGEIKAGVRTPHILSATLQ